METNHYLALGPGNVCVFCICMLQPKMTYRLFFACVNLTQQSRIPHDLICVFVHVRLRVVEHLNVIYTI